MTETGIQFVNAAPGGNLVQGNYIGTDATGTLNVGNGGSGVTLSSNSRDHTIGGTVAGARNIISGNTLHGVEISLGATDNFVQGNFIGTDVTGTLDLGNTQEGVRIEEAPTNTIGGTNATERNVISGNNSDGVLITGSGATGNRVQGNYIGTDSAGIADLGNTERGVFILDSPTNTIGGTANGAGNVISGNDLEGVVISQAGATLNRVEGNYIGTDASGAVDLGNTQDGVRILSASGNTIGGITAAARNIISGNDDDGIEIISVAAATTTNNHIEGNYIGVDVTGTVDLGNVSAGVRISFADGNVIGAAIPGAGNVVSGNGSHGIVIGALTGDPDLPTGNVVQGNFVGTDHLGTTALSNDVSGIALQNAPDSIIGGALPGEGNVISGNGNHGVNLLEPGSTGIMVQGNFIGTDVTGTLNLGNGTAGILNRTGANQNAIGGTTTGAGNWIAFNGGEGIGLGPASGSSIVMQGNIIFANGRLGIDLGNNGVTPNDPGDADTGINNFQNFPVLSMVTSSATDTTIIGTLNSTPSTAFRIEYFSNLSCDASGNGEGQSFLGFQDVTTAGNGDASVTMVFPTVVPVGQVITTTATNLGTNDTSEFSACVPVAAFVPGSSTLVLNTNDSGPGSLREAITNSNLTGGVDTISFNIPGTGPHTIAPLSGLPSITDPVILDGTTQPGYVDTPIIELDGTGAGNVFGLNIQAGNSPSAAW